MKKKKKKKKIKRRNRNEKRKEKRAIARMACLAKLGSACTQVSGSYASFGRKNSTYLLMYKIRATFMRHPIQVKVFSKYM